MSDFNTRNKSVIMKQFFKSNFNHFEKGFIQVVYLYLYLVNTLELKKYLC